MFFLENMKQKWTLWKEPCDICLDAENMYKHEFTMGKRQVVTSID